MIFIKLINMKNILNIYKCFSTINKIETDKWLKNVNNYIDKLIVKWQLINLEILPTGRLGIIIKAISKKYKANVILKVIPQFSGIYPIEKNAYINLSKEYMCPLLDYDDETTTLLLKQVLQKEPLSYDKDKNLLQSYFDIVYKNITNSYDKGYTIFDEYKKNIKIASNYKILKKERNKLTNYCLKLSNSYKNSNMYLLHSDLHEGNLLKEEDKIYAIDPLGYSAPKEFCFARFVNIKLFYGEEKDFENILTELINFISRWCNKKDFLKALLIDCDFLLNTAIVEIPNCEISVKKILNFANIIISFIEREE